MEWTDLLKYDWGNWLVGLTVGGLLSFLRVCWTDFVSAGRKPCDGRFEAC